MSAEHKPHSGHLDAELDQPEALATERLMEVASECLQRWDGFPTIPGSRRWSVNGRTALRELDRRHSNLIEQYERISAAFDLLGKSVVSMEEHERLKDQLETAREALLGIKDSTPYDEYGFIKAAVDHGLGISSDLWNRYEHNPAKEHQS